MPSRRQLLTVLASATAAGLAGCSGTATGGPESVDCHTRALAHGDGSVLDGGASATVADGAVRLAVPLAVADVRERGVDWLEVRDATGALAYVIPVSTGDADVMAEKRGVSEGQLRYEQHLGRRPFHGRYRIDAVDADGEVLDSVTVEFNCFPDGSG